MIAIIVEGLIGKDGVIGFIFAWIMLGILAVTAWVLFQLGYCLVDTAGVDPKYGTGVIAKKDFIAGYCTTTYISSGNVMVPQVICYDDEWRLYITRNYESSHIGVNRAYYDNANVGDILTVQYKTGRISGGFYVTAIE